MHVSAWFDLPSQLSDAVDGFRMPVLFCLSGLLVSTRLRNGWRDPRNGQRVLSLAYIYILWMVIYFALSHVTAFEFPGSIPSVKSLVIQLMIPTYSTLWFVYALMTYTAALIVLRKAPRLLVMGAFAACAIATHYLPENLQAEKAWVHVLNYGFFFALGALYRSTVLALVNGPQRFRVLGLRLLGASALYASATMVTQNFSLGPAGSTLAWLVVSVLAICAAFLAVTIACRAPGIARPLSFIGQRTVPIYLMHPVGMIGLATIPGLADHLIALDVLAAPTATFAIVATCLAVHSVAKRTPLRLLFTMPAYGNSPVRRTRLIAAT